MVGTNLAKNGITFAIPKKKASDMTKGLKREEFHPATLTCKIEMLGNGHWLAIVQKMELTKESSTQGQKAVDLKWKFEKGKTFYQELTADTTQDMKVMGKEVKQKQKQTFFFSWTPVEEKDKSWIIKQKIEGAKMEIQLGGNTISYDSTNPPAANNPLAEFFKALIGTEFTLTVSPEMKITKVEGRKELLDKLVAADQQMKPLLDSVLSEDAIKQMADPTLAAVPNKEVKIGETWKVPTKLNLGPIGSYDTTYEYKYVGKDEKKKDLDKIAVTATLKYVPPSGDAPQGGLSYRIKGGNLEGKTVAGTILFDAKKGRVVSSDMDLNLEGKLDIEINGMINTVELKQTQKTTVATTDAKSWLIAAGPKASGPIDSVTSLKGPQGETIIRRENTDENKYKYVKHGYLNNNGQFIVHGKTTCILPNGNKLWEVAGERGRLNGKCMWLVLQWRGAE